MSSPVAIITLRHTECDCSVSSDNALSYQLLEGHELTAEKCIDICDANHFIWAGVTEGRECCRSTIEPCTGRVTPPFFHSGCGNIVKASAAVITECPLACIGNANQVCGGVDRMLIYQRQPPVQAAIVGQYKTWRQFGPCHECGLSPPTRPSNALMFTVSSFAGTATAVARCITWKCGVMPFLSLLVLTHARPKASLSVEWNIALNAVRSLTLPSNTSLIASHSLRKFHPIRQPPVREW
jgi:hypothetical protein